MKSVEFRDRSRRAPGGEVRISLGKARKGSRLYRSLLAEKQTLEDLAKRGEWDVVLDVKRRLYTASEIHRLVGEHGLTHYRAALRSSVVGPTVGETVGMYLKTLDSEGTRTQYRSLFKRLQAAVGAGRRMEDLAPHEAADVLDGLRGDLAQNSIATFQAACSGMWRWWLVREKSVAAKAGRNPVATVNPWRESSTQVRSIQTRVRFLSREEHEALLDVALPPVKAAYALNVWCGLRISEFVHLRPQDVDLEQRIVRIQVQESWSPKGWPRYTRGVRDIPIHREELLPHLEQYAELYAGTHRFFVHPKSGDPWSVEAWRYRVQRDVEAAGMKYGREGDGVTPHTFRHTIASWMAQADIQMAKIAKFLGDTVTTVEKTYAHLFPQDIDEAVNRL